MHTWSCAGLPQEQILWQEFGCGPCVVSGGTGRGPEAPGWGRQGSAQVCPEVRRRLYAQETRIWGNSGKLGRMRLNVVSLRGEGFTCPLAATHAVGNCFRNIQSEQGWSRLTAGVSAAVQADQASSRQRTCLLGRRQ